jgi:hypothetical protein
MWTLSKRTKEHHDYFVEALPMTLLMHAKTFVVELGGGVDRDAAENAGIDRRTAEVRSGLLFAECEGGN